MTFRELYRIEEEKPIFPARDFLNKVAALTGCSVESARAWANGLWRPRQIEQRVLSAYFGVPASELFPVNEKMVRLRKSKRAATYDSEIKVGLTSPLPEVQERHVVTNDLAGMSW